MGKHADLVIVNSSWTGAHIRALWGRKDVNRIFPPCDTTSLQEFPINEESRQHLVVSLGQYRPEKNHMLQLKAFELFRKERPDSDVKFLMIGSVREGNEGDLKIIENLREEIAKNQSLQVRPISS